MMTITESIPGAVLTPHTYLGPAKVLAVDGTKVQLECPDCFPWAQVAISPRYEAEVGDSLLAIGSGDRWYVIGVLEGRGRTNWTVPGDLLIAAPAGKVEIVSGERIELKSRGIRFVAEEIEVTAKHLLQRLHALSQWITDALHQRAGRVISHVEGDYHLKAARIAHRADGDVKVNGKMIHLN